LELGEGKGVARHLSRLGQGRDLAEGHHLSQAHFHLAWCYAVGGEAVAAVAEFEEAIRLNPGEAGPYEGLGWVYRMVGEVEKSAESYQTAIRLDPAFVDAHSGLGMTCFAQKKLDEAEGAFRAALDLDPESHEAHRGLGEVMYARGDYDLAAESFTAALRLEPEDVVTHNSLGSRRSCPLLTLTTSGPGNPVLNCMAATHSSRMSFNSPWLSFTNPRYAPLFSRPFEPRSAAIPRHPW
jgi:tetratricopeptide (TPR) repeat protein